MDNNITISRAEYDRLLAMKTRIDVIEEIAGIVYLNKDDILTILGIKEAEKDA